jgi:hypothetical protein
MIPEKIQQKVDWIIAPYVRIDVACGKNGKRGEREEKASESTTNGRV